MKLKNIPNIKHTYGGEKGWWKRNMRKSFIRKRIKELNLAEVDASHNDEDVFWNPKKLI